MDETGQRYTPCPRKARETLSPGTARTEHSACQRRITERSVLPLLFLLFGVHLILFGWFSMAVERRVSPDSMNYISVARNAVVGDGFVQSAPGFNQPTFWSEQFSADAPRSTRSTHNVGYSLLIATIAVVARLEASDAAFALSTAAYGLALVTAFLFARRLWDLEAGLLAAGALAIVLRREFLYARTDPIAIALLLAMLALLARRATYSRALIAGLLAGLVLLVRGEAMAPVVLLGGLGCLLVPGPRVRLLLLYSFCTILTVPAMFVGEGTVYPPQLTSQSVRFPDASVAGLVVDFAGATLPILAPLAFFGALAWRRARYDAAPIICPNARPGILLAATWIVGYPVFLLAARLVVLTDEFDDRLLRPLLAVAVLCSAGFLSRALAERWRLLVATLAFSGSMLVNIGYNVTLVATGYDRSDHGRIAESARRSWIARHTGPGDFVIGQQVQELPYFITRSPDVASFSDAPYYPHVTKRQFDAFFRARCAKYNNLYLLLRRLEDDETPIDETNRSGAFVASLINGHSAPDYRLVADLDDALVFRYAGCLR